MDLQVLAMELDDAGDRFRDEPTGLCAIYGQLRQLFERPEVDDDLTGRGDSDLS
jgi:hypothetical protein